MEHAIWVRRYIGDRFFHIDDIVRVFDDYGEAHVYVDNEGEEAIGWIDGIEIEKIRKYRPEIVELTMRGHARRVCLEAGHPWSYHSSFTDELIPEPNYIATD